LRGENGGPAAVECTLEALTKKFPDLFSGKLGCVKGVSIKLDIDETVRPQRQPQRPVPFHLREAVEKELLKQEAMGIIERIDQNSGPTPWVANLVIVMKDKEVKGAKTSSSKPMRVYEADEPRKELDLRLTCDSRAQNKAIRRTKYPSKTVEDLVFMVNGSTVFSKVDIIKAFHQLMLDESCRNLTTITTHIGLFRYIRLHMGISCASEIFTETIRVMLADLKGQINMTDDILVHGKDAKEHHENLMAVLKRLEENGITLNISKCQFYRSEINFYGLRFTPEGISPTEDRCRALKETSAPLDAKALHSFLCTVLYSARFMQDICTIAEPLWRLTKKDIKWKWEETEEKAFRDLKEAISTKCMG
jgi:hypothetical protein